MITVDLITGFLGSGKTTFIKKYASHFIEKGENVGILENDYGAVNVDMLLLNDLRCDNCELEMVSGAYDMECHIRRFKTKLIAMGMSGYNRVIIEPSGIFDMDEFFDTLNDEPLNRWYRIGSIITIVDASLEDDLSKNANFFLASQISNTGIILLSKTQLVSSEKQQATLSHIKQACLENKICIDIDKKIFSKDWDALTPEDFQLISSSSYSQSAYVKLSNSMNTDFSTLHFLEAGLDSTQLKSITNMLFSTNDYGKIFRIKGFYKENDTWYQINATKNELSISPIKNGQEVFIIIGENLEKEKIQKLIH